jgi:hypothetical protein
MPTLSLAARAPRLLAAPLALAALAACAPTRVVEIDSRPAETRGASVYVNGERRGVTPTKLQVRFNGGPDDRVLLQVVKPNYRPAFQYWTPAELPEKRVFELEDE